MSLASDPVPSGDLAGDMSVRDSAPLLSGNALAAVSMMLFAAGFPAADMLLRDWSPIFLIAIRLAMALALLIPLWAMMDGWGAVRRANWLRGVWVGGIGFGSATYLLLLAQWMTDPITVALFATTAPLCATLIEVLNKQRRLTRNFVLGLIASIIGGVIATGGNLSAELGWGVGMTVLAGLGFSWASNQAVRDFPTLSAVGRSTITFAGAGLFTGTALGVAYVAGMDVMPHSAITGAQLGNLAIYAIAAMALSQILFIASVGKIGVALTTFHINLVPFYVMIILLSLGGEWNWMKATGAGVVCIGVLISQMPARRVKPAYV